MGNAVKENSEKPTRKVTVEIEITVPETTAEDKVFLAMNMMRMVQTYSYDEWLADKIKINGEMLYGLPEKE